jgi:hypothetical protein
MLMISSAVFSPVAAMLILAEARRGGRWPGRGVFQRVWPVVAAGAIIEGFSAWQLEYDLGVSVWSTGAHVVLVALTASLALIIARQALGRGGALLAVAFFVGLRGLGALVTAGVWGLEVPRFPLYLVAAVTPLVIAGFLSAFIGALLIAIISTLLSHLVRP